MSKRPPDDPGLDDLYRGMRALQPSAAQRKQWLGETAQYAEEMLKKKTAAPAFSVTEEAACDELRHVGIPRQGMELSQVLDLLRRNVDPHGVRQGNAGNFSYIPGNDNYLSALADYISSISNAFSGITEMCPGGGVMQDVLIQWMGKKIIGYRNPCGGDITSGGSIANLNAVVTARETHGIRARKIEKCAAYFSDQAHHSVRKALHIAGLDSCSAQMLPTDDRFRIDTDELRRCIERDARKGFKPWLIVGNAGTTDTGSIDDLETLADIAERYHCWLHVDGAYGACFALCQEGRKALKGLHLADSVTLDPHKSLFVPWGCGAVLVKDADLIEKAHHFSGSYMQDVSERHAPSPTNVSAELTRPFRALHLWMPLLVHGEQTFCAALEEKMLLARYAHRRLSQLPDFWVGPEPELSIVVFRHNGARTPEERDQVNHDLIQRIFRESGFFVSTTRIDNQITLRLAILSIRTHKETIDRFIEVLIDKANQIMESGT